MTAAIYVCEHYARFHLMIQGIVNITGRLFWLKDDVIFSINYVKIVLSLFLLFMKEVCYGHLFDKKYTNTT